MTKAQRRLVDIIRAYGETAEFWPVVNEWIDDGRLGADRWLPNPLALRNVNRTVAVLVREKIVAIDEDSGCFRLLSGG